MKFYSPFSKSRQSDAAEGPAPYNLVVMLIIFIGYLIFTFML